MGLISLPTQLPFTLDLLVLGVVSQLLAGLLLAGSVGKGRPRRLLIDMLGGVPPNLDYLRDAIHAKLRGQAGAAFFSVGAGLLLFGFLTPGGETDWRVQAGGSLVLLALAGVVMVRAVGVVDRTLRRYLRDYLAQQPFPFEAHVHLTREMGELFGVVSSGEETLESYVAKVREAIGLDRPARGLRRPSGRPLIGG